jgi:predicted ATPase
LPAPDLVSSTIGAALGVAATGSDPLPGLAAWLRDKQALIVLDNCEHVVDAAATAAETILKAAPGVCILATSREPLRAEGEVLHRLASLETPPVRENITANEALTHAAVELFSERARACDSEFVLTDTDASIVCEICRRLDGLPLALELAAAQTEFFGIQGLARGLSDRFALLTGGRRTALGRQQTLRATMDWSYDLLPDTERTTLQRLAVFRGDFTMEAASAVCGDENLSGIEVILAVANLAMKSLVATDISGDVTYFRLLETTRSYALDRLVESADASCVRRRHAEYYRNLMVAAVSDGGSLSDLEVARYARELDNVRTALDWSLSGSGDAEIGLALTAAYCPIWLDLSLLFECRERIERALLHLGPNTTLSPSLEIQLHITLGIALIITLGPADRTKLALNTGLQLAERIEDLDAQLRALRSLWALQVNVADHREAQSVAEKLMAVPVRSDAPIIAAVAHRIMGTR